jgi:putative addiction module killer protein
MTPGFSIKRKREALGRFGSEVDAGIETSVPSSSKDANKDAEPLDGGVSELRVDWGPGYRVYFARIGAAILLLLCAGHKTTQLQDFTGHRTCQNLPRRLPRPQRPPARAEALAKRPQASYSHGLQLSVKPIAHPKVRREKVTRAA